MPNDDWTQDYSERFDELRKNRVQLSFLKYGHAKKNFGTGNVDALGTMELCIEKYKKTGNTEYLVCFVKNGKQNVCLDDIKKCVMEEY